MSEIHSVEQDKATVKIRPFEQRILDEREALNDKLFKILDFTRRPNFLAVSYIERELIIAQSRAMTAYLDKLDKRIELFCLDDASR